MESVEWGEFLLGDLFEIKKTQGFNSIHLNSGSGFDYVTRTSQNQGVLRTTGIVENKKVNPSGVWSLGLLQMDFFFRNNPWYAGQFVRQITPKIEINPRIALFLTTFLNKKKDELLSVLVRDVDEKFRKTKVQLPVKDGSIDFNFMEAIVREIQQEKTDYVDTYLNEMGLSEKNLSDIEKEALSDFDKWVWSDFRLKDIFNNIEQGKRLKKDDQEKGDIPFVMAGNNDSGISNYISNPVTIFPSNSLTIDIFGNTFYRNYAYGAGDDTGCYWNDEIEYSDNVMLFFSSSIGKLMSGKFDFGNKLRSTRSHNYKIALPEKNGKPDFYKMETLISAIKKKAAMRINF